MKRKGKEKERMLEARKTDVNQNKVQKERMLEARKTDVNQNKVHLSKPIFSISAVIGLLQTRPRL